LCRDKLLAHAMFAALNDDQKNYHGNNGRRDAN
jgi:hypothetical protein